MQGRCKPEGERIGPTRPVRAERVGMKSQSGVLLLGCLGWISDS